MQLKTAQEDAQGNFPRERFILPYRLETFNIDEQTVPFLETKLCTNFTEYTDRFGTYSVHPEPRQPDRFKGHRALTHAVAGFFKNGGTRCFVARIERMRVRSRRRSGSSSRSTKSRLIAAPGITGRDSWERLVDHCDVTEDRFAILDCDEEVHERNDRMSSTSPC